MHHQPNRFNFSGILAFALVAALAPLANAQQVYVGVADQWDEMLQHPNDWKFVRENADGFYINFIEMNWMKDDPSKLAKTAALFTHKSAVLESDHKDATGDDDQRYLTQLQAAGFTVPITSLNYSWSPERASNLKNFKLLPNQAPRLNLVQQGPWVVSGNVTAKSPDNDAYRTNVDRADGISTDGPMGFWLSDQGGMRSGSISMVKYAHAHDQKALVMLCPYGAQNKLYTPAQALPLAQECVRNHEDAGAIPDIWSVFEYATSIPATPEQVHGVPISTTTGMAYWLIHHLKDPDGAAQLFVMPQQGLTTSARLATAEEVSDRIKEVKVAQVAVPEAGERATRTVTYELRNSSPWLDLCPLLKAKSENPDWDILLSLNGADVTSAIWGKDGLACVGDIRLWHAGNPPTAPLQLKITATPKAAAKNARPLVLSLSLASHPSYPQLIEQRFDVRFNTNPIP